MTSRCLKSSPLITFKRNFPMRRRMASLIRRGSPQSLNRRDTTRSSWRPWRGNCNRSPRKRRRLKHNSKWTKRPKSRRRREIGRLSSTMRLRKSWLIRYLCKPRSPKRSSLSSRVVVVDIRLDRYKTPTYRADQYLKSTRVASRKRRTTPFSRMTPLPSQTKCSKEAS